MIDGSAPSITHGRHERRRQGGWSGHRLQLTIWVGAFAAATVAVPWFVTRSGGQSPPSGLRPAPVELSATPTTGLPSSTEGGAVTAASSTTPSATAGSNRTAAASNTTPAGFTPIAVQAEDPGNILSGGAEVVACDTCDGGYRVRYLCLTCQLVVRTSLPASGPRTVTIVYEAGDVRTIKISINGALPVIRTVSGQDWTTPQALNFTAVLQAGALELTLYNDDAPAPDIDKVLIS